MHIEKQAAFYRQLAQLLDAGVPLSRSLDSLARATPGAIGRAALAMRQRIEQGATFTEAAAGASVLFDPLQLKVLKVGEHTGRLPVMLGKLAEGLEMEAKFRKEILTRLAYPLTIYHVAALIMGLVALILKSVVSAIMTVISLLSPLYGTLAVLFLLCTLRRHVLPVRYFFDTLMTYTPILGGVMRNLAVARFTRAFESVYVAGFSPIAGLPLAAESTGNVVIQRALLRAMPYLESGEDLAVALNATGVFPATTMSMFATGVESGKLDQMLLKVNENATFNAQQSIERIGRIVPLIIYLVIMGFIVSLIVTLLYGYATILNDAMNG